MDNKGNNPKTRNLSLKTSNSDGVRYEKNDYKYCQNENDQFSDNFCEGKC